MNLQNGGDENIMDMNVLKSKMTLKGDTQIDLAGALNIDKNTLCLKMNQKNDFKQSEIDMIAKRYDLTGDEIKQIFFS